ncbi:MAG: peptidoglycan bridge formation glycyltransferase FemA/FemB family protein [Caldilineaceae bacterium]|nr:peptidoglycan bridge formation glycyltransferase FemA/FemB family protein [Caldilineaceae bacterium]MCY4117450.1 peptidoglycan bridge formation glycyltransferase FemA/FemB family protein [Caldilineaceae bacterium]
MTEQAGNWNDFVSGHAHAHLLQTDEWAELKGRFGWRARRILLPGSDGDASRAGAMVLFRKSMGQVLAYVPRGPLVDWSDAGLTEATVARICAAARQEGAFALKIEPGLLDTAQNRGRLAAAGFHPSPQTIQPRSTVVVDLQPDEDTILARMKSKWRYNIRLAARKEVTVRELGAHELPLFQQLVSETGTREGFSVHSAAYYRAAYDLLASRWGVFLLATHRGEPLASIAVFAVGPTAWYLWGASNNHRRNLMPNHALQWEAIRWAKARGCTRYDLWGIPDEVGAVATGLWDEGRREVLAEQAPVDVNAFPAGDLWGVFRFKQGFGGAVERTVGAWDLPLNRSVYGLYRGLLLAKDRVATVQKRSGDGRQNDERGDARPRRARSTPAELEPVTQEAAWEELMAQLPSDRDHVLQSWTWGAVKAASGWEVERWAVRADGRLLGIFQFLWRQPLASLPLRVAYVPKGPLLDWSDDEAAALVLARIEKLGRRRGCLQVKIDPDVAEESAEGKRLTPLLARRGWRFSPEQVQFKNTGFTDLSETDEQLLASFKSKWRYNIRLAQRRGLKVRSGNTADLQNFYRLYRETSVRDNFLIRPFAYYEALWRTFLESQENGTARTGGTLLFAEHPQEELPVAGLFLLRHGCRTIYFNGASSERRRRDMPNYLLQWRALQWAKVQGCTVYDWWGAPTAPDDPSDPLQGVWRFKQGFAARLAVHTGAWDWSPSPLLWHGYHRGKSLLAAAIKE